MTKNTKSRENNVLKSYNMLLYFAGSMIMYEPSEECIIDFWAKGNLNNLPVSSKNPNFIKAASQLRESCKDISTCGKLMKEDYVRLFSRQELPLAPAYESHYNFGNDPKLCRPAPTVTEFYDSYGWKSRFRGRVNDDHISIELLFLTILVDKYLDMDDDACSVEMRGEIRRFIDQHILSWIKEWNNNIQKYAQTLCYKGIGTLILASVEDLFSYLEHRTAKEESNGILKN